MARLSLRFLGAFQALLDGEPITGFESTKVQALLAYLATEAERPCRRESLVGLIWPDWPERSARRNLSHALANLRTAIGDRDATPPYLSIARETIQFNRDSDCWIDVQVFRALSEAEQADATQEDAIALYRGSFLEGFSLKESAAFEDWVVLTRERLQRQASMVLQRLVEAYEGRGEHEQACEIAWRWVELEPWREDAHRRLMRLLALSGQRSAALAQYETCRRLLATELGVEPSAETVDLYERIRDGRLAPPGETPQAAPEAPRQASISPGFPAASEGGPVPSGTWPIVSHTHSPDTRRAAGVFPGGERRLVTIVSADVIGSMDLLERIGSEAWVEVMGNLHRILRTEIDRMGGEVSQSWDEGLVALFGATTAREDDPERGVLASLSMLEQVGAYVDKWVEQGAPDRETTGARHSAGLDVRIGVHTGEAIAAHPAQDLVTGQAVVFARRMQPAIQPGTVLVSENTWRLARSMFEWEPLGEMPIEGASQPLAAYRPLAHKAHSDKGRDLAGWSSPLVGRGHELRALQEAVERLRAGVGGIVTVVGEAGIGKSRLVAEARRSAGVQWVEGRCLSYATFRAYQVWIDLLRGLLRLAPHVPPTATRDALWERVQTLCPDCALDVHPFLGRMLSLPLESDAQARLDKLEAEGLQIYTFRAVVTLLERMARQHPLAIACEDLHWADPTSLALLERVLALTDRLPLLVICAFRPQREEGCWRIRETAARLYAHRHTDLELDPLSPIESKTLVDHLLLSFLGTEPGQVRDDARHLSQDGGEALSEQLRDLVLRRAEGNPFFTQEIVHSLVEDETIVLDETTHRWRIARQATQVSIPDTLQGVLLARIDRLPQETRQVLHLASTIGRIFAYRLLAEMAETCWNMAAPDLDTHLVQLQRAQMIREQVRPPEREYILRHYLTQEAAYHGLLKQERQLYHRHAAEALERLYPERLEEQLELLAHHWEQAGERERAVDYLWRAGKRAASQFANAEAADYLGRALHLAPEDDPAGRYAVLLAREEVYHVQGDRERQRLDLEALQRLAQALGDDERHAEIACRQARYAVVVGEHQAAIAHAREAEGHWQWGWALYRQGDYTTAQTQLGQALTLAQAASQHQVEATSLRVLGLISAIQAQHPAALAYHQQALQRCTQIGDQRGVGTSLHNLGEVYANLGDYAQAKTCSEQALGILRETGDRVGEGWVLKNLGTVCGYLGDYAQADAYTQQAIRVFRETGARYGETIALLSLGAGLAWSGNYAGAEASFEQALCIYRQTGDPWGECMPLLHLGEVSLGQGKLDQAGAYFEQALGVSRQTGNRFVEGMTLIALGWAATRQHNYALATGHAEQALRLFRQEGWPGAEWMPLAFLSLCSLRLGDDERAREYSRQALQIPLDPADRTLERYWFSPLLLSYASAGLGHTLVDLGQLDHAASVYRSAVDKMRGLRPLLTLEPSAGLAQIALAKGDLEGALDLVEAYLPCLEAYPVSHELLEPFRVHLICFRVLQAHQDPRAAGLLNRAYQLLHEQAAEIGDPGLRRSFLEEMPVHREIVDQFVQHP